MLRRVVKLMLWLQLIWLSSLVLANSVQMDVSRVGTLPVLKDGRIKPLDTVARNSLLFLSGKQQVTLDGEKRSAMEWFFDVATQPNQADQWKVILINHPGVKQVCQFGPDREKEKYFSFQELLEKHDDIMPSVERALQRDPKLRSPFQKEILNLNQKLELYNAIKHAFFISNWRDLESALTIMLRMRSDAIRLAASGSETHFSDSEKQVLDQVWKWKSAIEYLNSVSMLTMIPKQKGEMSEWQTVGGDLMVSLSVGHYHPVTQTLAQLVDAYRHQDSASFQEETDALLKIYSEIAPDALKKAEREALFNNIQPFYLSMIGYVLAFTLCLLSFLFPGKLLNLLSTRVLGVSCLIHTLGLLTRMIIQGRPPVTNLYSSAVFVGWVAVLMGVGLEKVYKNRMGAIVASSIGFLTLIVAHHLAVQGDTLEMMQAVLDSNFWLSTHVVTITMGYSACFLAGALGVVYIVRGLFIKAMSKQVAHEFHTMVYGIICFALLFSFIGTVLGGIWADQSWGRFWGWDPKENGAIMIVLWNAIILHARLKGAIKSRGLMVMAVFGNIVTAFSWFGVNMLGVGLHSYGFMEKAFVWLLLFVLLQLTVIILGLLPHRYWLRSEERSLEKMTSS